jgi:hypothetical protein
MMMDTLFSSMNKFISNLINPVRQNNGWNRYSQGRNRLEKHGFEIYFHNNDGFELTIRDPDTMERRVVYENRGPDVHSPLYTAILLHILENVEQVVKECESGQKT